MPHVRIYTSAWCGYCNAAKRFLTQAKGVTFEEIDLTGKPEERAWLASTTGQRTVPQIFIGDTPIGGYTDMRALDASGELDELLQG